MSAQPSFEQSNLDQGPERVQLHLVPNTEMADPGRRRLRDRARDTVVRIGIAGVSVLADFVDTHPVVDPVERHRKKLLATGTNPSIHR